MFGKFQYKRTALIPAAPADTERLAALSSDAPVKMLFPLDEALGVDILPFKITAAAMLEISFRAQELRSYEAAGRVLRRNTLVDVQDDTVRAVANHVGALVFKEDEVRAETAWNELISGQLRFPTAKQDHTLYIEVDGAIVHTRRKPDASGAEPESGFEDSNSESAALKSAWMENKLGVIFNSKDFNYWWDGKGERLRKIGRREYTAYLGSAEEFKKHLWAAARRNGYGNYSQTILISDGAAWIRNLRDELFPEAQQILDFYHLSKNISNFAKEIFNFDKTKYIPWADEVIELFRKSKYKEALPIISNFGAGRLAKSKFKLYDYIVNNINNIDYAAYVSKGWYIGSGATESANKTVLQSRLKQAGMKWNAESAQCIVSLMSKAKSGLWEKEVVEPVLRLYQKKGAEEVIGHLLGPGPWRQGHRF
jgi:hypothetical protein